MYFGFDLCLGVRMQDVFLLQYCNFMNKCILYIFFTSFARFLSFHPSAYRTRRVPPSSSWPGLAHDGGRWKRRKRGREVLLPVWSLVQQPADGPAALRGQETPQERSQGTTPGAASGQSGCHWEHRSASWPRAENTSDKWRAGVWMRKDNKGGDHIHDPLQWGRTKMFISLLIWGTFCRCNTKVSCTNYSQIKLAASTACWKDQQQHNYLSSVGLYNTFCCLSVCVQYRTALNTFISTF